jgi:hypothetical protein
MRIVKAIAIPLLILTLNPATPAQNAVVEPPIAETVAKAGSLLGERQLTAVVLYFSGAQYFHKVG